jgi:hypothetical protein
LPLLLIPEPVAPPRVPCLHWRILRALALLLIGSGIGAALVYAASESGHQPKTEAKYYTVLPFAVPAVPPQEILYVDKWRIVAIDPSSLAESVKAEQAAKVEPPRAVEMLAPAMPIAPPPQIIIVERGSTKHPKIKHRVAEMHPPPLPRLGVPVVEEPKKSEDDGDVAEQIRRWLSGAN